MTTKINKVINVKKEQLKKMGYDDLVDWLSHDNHVYIGRNMSFYVKGATKSKWSNPFNVKKYGRDECLKLYKQYIQDNADLLAALSELKGKILGCWCHPDKCHGDILVQLLSEQENNENNNDQSLPIKKLMFKKKTSD